MWDRTYLIHRRRDREGDRRLGPGGPGPWQLLALLQPLIRAVPELAAARFNTSYWEVKGRLRLLSRPL